MEEELYTAASWGELEEVRRILEDTPDIDINSSNDIRRTPLYIAASWGYWDVVELLLKHGAVVDEYTLSITCYTMPRTNEEVFEECYYYHKEDKKHQAYKMAKDFMKNARKDKELSDVLVTLNEDYNTLIQAEIDPEQSVPDYIMNIAIYYNHFATIVLLLQADKSRKLQQYNNRLLEQREKQFREIQMDDQDASKRKQEIE